MRGSMRFDTIVFFCDNANGQNRPFWWQCPCVYCADEIRVVDRFHWTTFLCKGAFTKNLQTFYVSLQFTNNNFRNLVDPSGTETDTTVSTSVGLAQARPN